MKHDEIRHNTFLGQAKLDTPKGSPRARIALAIDFPASLVTIPLDVPDICMLPGTYEFCSMLVGCSWFSRRRMFSLPDPRITPWKNHKFPWQKLSKLGLLIWLAMLLVLHQFTR